MEEKTEKIIRKLLEKIDKDLAKLKIRNLEIYGEVRHLNIYTKIDRDRYNLREYSFKKLTKEELIDALEIYLDLLKELPKEIKLEPEQKETIRKIVEDNEDIEIQLSLNPSYKINENFYAQLSEFVISGMLSIANRFRKVHIILDTIEVFAEKNTLSKRVLEKILKLGMNIYKRLLFESV